MILSAITTAVQRFGFDGNDPVTDWINEALTEFTDSFNWPFLRKQFQTTLAASATALTALPTDIGPIRKMWYLDTSSNPTPIDYRDRITVESLGQYAASSGSPYYWSYVTPDVPAIYPVADITYTIFFDYDSVPPVLVNAGDTPGIPARYHYALVRGAAAIGLDVDNQEDRAAAQYQRFRNIIDQAISRYQQPQFGTFSRVRRAC